jgi:hypothetical protein
MDNNRFDRSHFLRVTLSEVERNSWSPRFTGTSSVSEHAGFSGVQTAMGGFGSPGGVTRALTGGGRAARVRRALESSECDALQLLDQKFHSMRIDAIAPRLLSACLDLGLMLGSRQVMTSGNVLSGPADAANMPRLLAAYWGLKSIAPTLSTGIATRLSDYDDAFKNAWGPRHPQATQGDRLLEFAAARCFARGHVVAVTALLTGILAYTKRGNGTPAQLLKQLEPEIQTSARLGAPFAQWLQQQHQEILAHPLLNRRADGLSGGSEAATPITLPARAASLPSVTSAPTPDFNPLDNMDQDVQAASMVRAAANGTPFCAVCTKAGKAAA